jgi:hypothetical protein
VLDWFASQLFTNPEPKRLSNADAVNYHPLLDASALPSGTKPYPRSISDLQNLLVPQLTPELATNNDVLTVIEADGLLSDLPTGLAGWEEINLSVCFINYALERGAKELDFDAIRSKARNKYTALEERTRIVVHALNKVLGQSGLADGNRKIAAKTKAALTGG